MIRSNQKQNALSILFVQFTLITALVISLPDTPFANEYLSSGEVISIGLASSATMLIGEHVKKIPEGKKPLITGHLPFEQSFQQWLGGNCQIGKRNFLDDTLGSLITPVSSALLLTGINISSPRNHRGKDVAQDMFLFVSGLLATNGVTNITKGLLTRSRPYRCIFKNANDTLTQYNHTFTNNSFFSGHTSSAFFSVGFLNLRTRETLRNKLSASEYDKWVWISPILLYGWASVVGLSRVQAYKHHLSDVIAGAIVGVLMAELFYNFGKNANTTAISSRPMQLRIVLSFS